MDRGDFLLLGMSLVLRIPGCWLRIMPQIREGKEMGNFTTFVEACLMVCSNMNLPKS
jgi:hypothetical protein